MWCKGREGSHNLEKKLKLYQRVSVCIVTDENDKIYLTRVHDLGSNNSSHIGNEWDGSYNGNANDSVSDNGYPFTLEGEEEVWRDKRGDKKTIVLVEQISSLTIIIPQQYKWCEWGWHGHKHWQKWESIHFNLSRGEGMTYILSSILRAYFTCSYFMLLSSLLCLTFFLTPREKVSHSVLRGSRRGLGRSITPSLSTFPFLYSTLITIWFDLVLLLNP